MRRQTRRLVAVIVVTFGCSSGHVPRPPAPAPASAPAPVVAPADPFAAQNLGFEHVDGAKPRGWEARVANEELATVTDEKHGGARSLRLEAAAGDRAAKTVFDAKPYVGKRVRLQGFIKTQQVGGAAIWLRADGAEDEMIVIDVMRDRRVTGTAGWTKAVVEIDVPPNAAKLVAGGMVLQSGTAWFDDLAIEVAEIKPPAQITLAGTVTDPAGASVAGAEVALIDSQGTLAKHVRSDDRGRFRFEVLEGKWGVSAHRAGAVGGYLAQRQLAQSVSDLKIALGKTGGVTVQGKTTHAQRPGTYLQIGPQSDNDSDIFAVPVASDGSFSAVLPRGDVYYVAIADGGVRQNLQANGTFPRTGDRVDVTLDLPAFEPPPPEVVTYIVKHGIALASTEAGSGFTDMAAVGKLVGKARIVALGEATHGTREFFQLKHRFLEYLVAKQGFTVFAIEANQPECRAINDYVLHGKGTARDALAGIYFWTWNTEEVLAMIEWMRAWNADATHTRKVQFTGFDMQATKVAHANVAAFVERAAPDRAQALLAPIAMLGDTQSAERVAKATPDQRKAITAGLSALVTAFDKNRKVWARPDFDDVRHDLTILEQAAAMYMEKSSFDARDRAMAANVGWLLDHTRARIVLWAHNGHISNTLLAYRNMGNHLRKRYRGDYLNVGFVFGEGSFRALDFTKPSKPLSVHTLGPPPEYHASVAFSRTGKPRLVLDLRALPGRGVVADWFAARHPTRETGAVFAGEQNMTELTVLPKLYDAVIYVDKTTPARPLKK